MSDIAIKVENISKKYQIGENKSFPTLRDKLMELPNRIFKGPKKTKEFWALKDVSFEVKKGEVLGIIGRNGAGKSTLLKILARITEPTSGQITMYGRVASMLEVGTGFNQELTGRENIYLNGAIIGMTKKEIQSKFDDIVEFSGVGKFLDTPVKHYSSGMYVRLAFAVAAHLEADILLIDEVLSVGDADFQKKCLGKIRDIARSGRTVIFVSHDIRSIEQLCSSIIYLVGGKISAVGQTEDIINIYLSTLTNTAVSVGPLSNKISIIGIKVRSTQETIYPTDNIYIEINWQLQDYLDSLILNLGIDSELGDRIFSLKDAKRDESVKKGEYVSIFEIPKNTLRPGMYNVGIGGHQMTSTNWFYVENIYKLKIYEKWNTKCQIDLPGYINVLSKNTRNII